MAALRSRNLAEWSPPLLQREAALARIRAARLAAHSGRGGIVAVEAAAGLGKTRLLAHARRSGAQTGATVVAARATELERELPFGVVGQLLDSLSGERRRRLDDLLDGPAATARPVLSPKPAVAAADTDAVLYGLYRAAAGLSADGPLLVVVDDAHWADLPSLRFLSFLAPRLERLPILLVVASRPATGDARVLLDRLGSDPQAASVALEPLDADAVAELLASALAEPAERQFVTACHELAGGNPFLTCELARTALSRDVRPTADQAERVRTLLPAGAARSVLTRLAGAADPAHRLATAVAVLGDGCEPYLAGELAGLDAAAVDAAADDLRLRGILDPGAALRFLHPLVRDAVYRDLPAGARAVEHRRAARLLRRHRLPPTRVAAQLLATEPDGDPDTPPTLRAAAVTALAQGAPQPAVAYLQRALREPLDPEARLDLLELLVVAAVRAADLPALLPHQSEIEEALGRDPARLRRTAHAYATVLFGLGRRDEGLELIERAVDVAVAAGDVHGAVTLDAQLTAYRQDSPRRARERFARYPALIAEDDGSAAGRLLAALAAGWASQQGEPATRAAELARRALGDGAIFDESPDAPPVTQAVLVLARADELGGAIRAASRMVESATRRGSMVGLTSGWFARGCAQRRVDVAAAETDLQRAVEAARLAGFLKALPPLSAALVDVLVELDRLDEADAALTEADLDGALPPGFWFDIVLFSRGKLRLEQGRTSDAADDLLELRERVAAGTRDFAGVPGDGLAAVALARLGETTRARRLAEEQLAELRAWGAPSAVAEGLVAFGTVAGGDEGLAAMAEAVELAGRSPATVILASTLVEHGAALLTHGRRESGLAQLRAGFGQASRCGAAALARRSASLLADAGDRHAPIGAASLTPSERNVAELAIRGLTNREIAAARHITVKTVESHLRAAYGKLGIASRHELTDVLPPR